MICFHIHYNSEAGWILEIRVNGGSERRHISSVVIYLDAILISVNPKLLAPVPVACWCKDPRLPSEKCKGWINWHGQLMYSSLSLWKMTCISPHNPSFFRQDILNGCYALVPNITCFVGECMIMATWCSPTKRKELLS
ncbi:uncharacterized protein LOC119311932 [Triticum dicoccoides]|uniref:uncharacterized protein LOC119311932 n=1 Tax=Triticum dicoccoides TaxID=85692 RepID=UPI00188E3215|nr:uncharacterized protein LOC119311932 [Triticum dicoccoides]